VGSADLLNNLENTLRLKDFENHVVYLIALLQLTIMLGEYHHPVLDCHRVLLPRQQNKTAYKSQHFQDVASGKYLLADGAQIAMLFLLEFRE